MDSQSNALINRLVILIFLIPSKLIFTHTKQNVNAPKEKTVSGEPFLLTSTKWKAEHSFQMQLLWDTDYVCNEDCRKKQGCHRFCKAQLSTGWFTLMGCRKFWLRLLPVVRKGPIHHYYQDGYNKFFKSSWLAHSCQVHGPHRCYQIQGSDTGRGLKPCCAESLTMLEALWLCALLLGRVKSLKRAFQAPQFFSLASFSSVDTQQHTTGS